MGNVKITRIPAQHGTYKNCGEAMGVMFSAETEKRFILLVIQYGITEYRRQSMNLNQRL